MMSNSSLQQINIIGLYEEGLWYEYIAEGRRLEKVDFTEGLSLKMKENISKNKL